MLSQPDAKVMELLVLASLRSSAGPVTALAHQLEQPAESVRAAVARLVDSLWPKDADRAAAEAQERAGLLAADADRDAAVQRLSAAFSEGRLSAAELESRTGNALSARTYGDLDGTLQGLGGLPREVRSHPVRKALFWVVALLMSPFVLMGTLLFAFGTDAGDHVGGLILLIVLLPGLFALHRSAWPRR